MLIMGDFCAYFMPTGPGFFLSAYFYTWGEGYIMGLFFFTQTWVVGVVILLAVIATAFLGYVLP